MKYLDFNKNWMYSAVDFDYDSSHCTGECEDYCRCNKVINQKITSVDLWPIAEYIADGNKDPILLYCIERLLVSQRIYDHDFWYIGVSGGYYGEEVDSITLESVTEINKKLKQLESLKTTTERIRMVLTEEYGYLLNSIKDLEFETREVNRYDIKIPNDSYHGKIGNKSYEMYNDYQSIYIYQGFMGVVREDDDGNLILVDGYHRYAASGNPSISGPALNEKFEMIVGKKS